MGESRPVKKTKKVAAATEAAAPDADDWENWETLEEAPKKKKAKVVEAKVPEVVAPEKKAEPEYEAPKKKAVGPKVLQAKAQDLLPGTMVLYWDGYRGVVRDAFVPIDQYWIAQEEDGEIVKDEAGEIVQFKASELQLLAPPPIAKPRPPDLRRNPLGGVLVLGTELQMLDVLQHFGSPDAVERQNPQQLLAIPCHLTDTQSLLPTASEGIEPGIVKLAHKLRPDIHVALRSFHIKQATEQLGGELLRLSDYYCLTAVQLPFAQEDIDASSSDWERHWREDVCNQIDLCVTAGGCWGDESTSEDAAKRALGEQCGIRVSDGIWDDEFQRQLRHTKGVPNLPLHFTDANCLRVTVLMLPEEVETSGDGGVLCFDEAAPLVEEEPEVEVAAPQVPAQVAAKPPAPQPAPVRAAPQQAGGGSTSMVGGKTVSQWEKEQEEFAHLPPLAANWLRIKSKSSGEIYFYNKKTQEATFEQPLPDGWTKEVSKSTGKVYYFNAKKRQSTFERPTA